MLECLGATACPSDHTSSVHKTPNQSASRMVDVELKHAILIHFHTQHLHYTNVIK